MRSGEIFKILKYGTGSSQDSSETMQDATRSSKILPILVQDLTIVTIFIRKFMGNRPDRPFTK